MGGRRRIMKLMIINSLIAPALAVFLSSSDSTRLIDELYVIKTTTSTATITGCYMECLKTSGCTHIGVKSLVDTSRCHLVSPSPRIDNINDTRKVWPLMILTQEGGNTNIPSFENFGHPVVSELTLGQTDFGVWTGKVFCPLGSKVSGFRIKVQLANIRSDDTGLNGIQLACSDGTVSQQVPGHFGEWLPWLYCDGILSRTANFVHAFALRSEPYQKRGDDTAANNVKMTCNNGATLKTPATVWGDWLYGKCALGSYLCGIEANIELPISGDNTGVNKLKFLCCY